MQRRLEDQAPGHLERLFQAWNRRFPTFGTLSLGCFWIAIISGVALIWVFDPQDPAGSLQTAYLTHPAAVFFRALHYWSGQLFLVWTLIHFLEYLLGTRFKKISKAIWLRLVLLLPVLLYIMLSGYMLKADGDGNMARQIFTALLQGLPLIGESMVAFLAGPEESYLVLYLQHAALATIISLALVAEHIRNPWPRSVGFLGALIACVLFSLFLPPVVHLDTELIVKGPWYFLGFQEVLHMLSNPAWVWVVGGLVLTVLITLPYMNEKVLRRAKTGLAFVFFGYVILTVIAVFFRGPFWIWDYSVLKNPGKLYFGYALYQFEDTEGLAGDQVLKEGCLYCHVEVSGFSPGHHPEQLDCTTCHLGYPWTRNEVIAHKGMEPVPGNFRTLGQTCGTADCHADIAARISNSLMATGRGIVSVDRFAFGEQATPDGSDGLQDLGDSPADKHLKALCSNCHLAKVKEHPEPVHQRSRGGGCTACHVNYLQGMDHPGLDLNISNDHCFGCHSRSGRISTNYEGWYETDLLAEELPDQHTYRILDDGRVFDRAPADVHFEAGLSCVDCHSGLDTMGDGFPYAHQEEQVGISCTDCHFKTDPETKLWDALSDSSKKVVWLREKQQARKRKFLTRKKTGEALVNTSLDSFGEATLTGKLNQKTYVLGAPAVECTKQAGHERVSCQSCHSAWSPTCLGCHTQWEVIEGKGSWVEYGGDFRAELPTLGVIEGSDGDMIEPFIPGMVMTLNKHAATGEEALPDLEKQGQHLRLYAPSVPHTTSVKGRSCQSCHWNPVALGYGRGSLQLHQAADTKWDVHLKSEFPISTDGLAEDAWIPFVIGKNEGKNIQTSMATRSNARPFNLDEQKNILRVGACMTCHDWYQSIDFKHKRENMHKNCIELRGSDL